MNIIILIILVLIILFLKNKKDKIVYVPYTVKGYSDLKQDSESWSYTPGGIPKIIIKTSWQTRDAFPKQIISTFDQLKKSSPDYQLYYFDNSECDQFMEDYSPRALAAYKKIIPGAFKADLFRVCILEKYGGCYSDIGHSSHVSFDEITGSENIVLVKDCPLDSKTLTKCTYYGIHNALMCSTKNHGFFKLLVDKTCENIENEYYGINPLDVTGPTMIGKQFNCYFLGNCSYENTNLIKPGDFVYLDTKVRILNYAANDQELRYILSDKGKILIATKFDNYYTIMYHSKKTITYTVLWNNRKIYNN